MYVYVHMYYKFIYENKSKFGIYMNVHYINKSWGPLYTYQHSYYWCAVCMYVFMYVYMYTCLHVFIYVCIYVCIHMRCIHWIETCSLCGTGWQRCIRCLKLQVILHKISTSYRALLREMNYKDKATCESLLFCTIRLKCVVVGSFPHVFCCGLYARNVLFVCIQNSRK